MLPRSGWLAASHGLFCAIVASLDLAARNTPSVIRSRIAAVDGPDADRSGGEDMAAVDVMG